MLDPYQGNLADNLRCDLYTHETRTGFFFFGLCLLYLYIVGLLVLSITCILLS